MNRGEKKKAAIVQKAGAVAAVTAILFGLFWTAQNFIGSYKNSIASESASHLVEISYQVASYVEGRIERDGKVAESIENSLRIQPQASPDDLLIFIKEQCGIWNISNVIVYLEDGRCVNAAENSIAAARIREVKREEKGRKCYMQIEQSVVTHTIIPKAPVPISDTRIAAVSVVQNLSSFIDEMEFSSFDGDAFMYLAQSGGTKISQLTHPNAPEVDNILLLFKEMRCTCLSQKGYTVRDTMATEETSTFLCENDSGSWYVVLMPVKTGGSLWQLCYWAPEHVVNAAMDSFTSSVILLSAVIIVFFAICIMILFSLIYKTRKKQFDDELVVRDRLFNLLAENTQIAFALHSIRKMTPLYCSDNVENIIGYRYLQLTKDEHRYQLVLPDGGQSEQIARINEKLADWDGTNIFTSDYIPHAVERYARYYVLRLYPTGNDAEFVGIAQDVTREREREEALKNALAMADSASLAKTRFLANMSHDIRTPMNAIMNMTRFIMESTDEPSRHREYLKTILDSSEHLLHIINDILNMSRIESGQDIVAAEPFELQKVLSDICEMIRPLCAARRQRFAVDFGSLQSNRLIGDKLKLSQILINLLNNAMKFTPVNGRVHFSVEEMNSLRSETAAFRFVIEDNGIGIETEKIDTLFEPFTRAENSRVGHIEGTGLGLSICKSYVTAMGGTITCESAVDAGSVFSVELSFEKDLKQPSHTNESVEGGGVLFENMRALLCEDNGVNQVIARRILEKYGFEVEIASDGAEAVEKFLRSDPGHYDVIYMDIQMPKMNGYEAAAAIRASGRPQAETIPIIAMTANVYAEDVEKSRVSGMNGHVGKPIVIRDLLYATSRALKIAEQ